MKVLITGTAGFIGFHLANLLLSEGCEVYGYDGMTDYYDVSLKKKRHDILAKQHGFVGCTGMLEDKANVSMAFSVFKPDIVVHLAAQAGVRYSLENPRSYIDSNVIGTFNVMEEARRHGVKHLLMASTSSIYGSNIEMPFSETVKADCQMTIYAATKKSAESMAHAYSHLHKIPTTIFRFFTVYGPWGRPDMALFKFTKGILSEDPIDIYNNGEMYRDFTYVSDLVLGIRHLLDAVPLEGQPVSRNDSLSNAAPYRVVNIGNSQQVKLINFVEAIESAVGKKAIRNYLPMQTGDVPATWANTALLQDLTGFCPDTDYRVGVKEFVDWYRNYYGK